MALQVQTATTTNQTAQGTAQNPQTAGTPVATTVKTPVTTAGAQNQAAIPGMPTDEELFPKNIDLNTLKTSTGKLVKDFEVPENLIKTDPQIIDMIMRSESMKDSERQYWFNLTEVMNDEQMEKLRDILTRERRKLAEIEAKYGKTKPQLSPEEAQKKNAEIARQQAEKKQEIAQKEAAEEASEKESEEDILAQL